MKAITLHQPWAELVAKGAKQIETRSWNTWHRGPLAIHASKNEYLMKDWWWLFPQHKQPKDFGCIVAVCNLVHVQRIPIGKTFMLGNEHGKRIAIPPVDKNGPEYSYGDYTPGRYAWILEDVQRLDEPIPVIGKRRLWNTDPEIKLPDLPLISSEWLPVEMEVMNA